MTRAIGFIGLGLMGHAFTRRLVACGYRVAGYDIEPARLEAAAHH
ncbi:MAG: NAD(P)-binding domain-containing protein, partial [Geminicoccales bacterium]